MAKITIFGMAGTGKTSTGKEVAKRLGYEFFSGGDFMRDTAKSMGITLMELEELSKHEDKYDIERDKIIAEFGRTNDNFVVEARLAWHFIPDSFKICFLCDFNKRTERIAGREKKDVEVVREETRAREKSIYDRFEKYYGIKDFEDEKHFDMIIDTATMSLSEVIETIIKKLREKKFIK